MKQEAFFSVEGLSCGYADGFSIEGVSFSLERGSFTGVLGRNGSGKTTLFRGLTGELKPQSGSICLSGEELTKMSLKERARRVAVIAQFPTVADMTVEEYVLLGRIPYRRPFQFFDRASDRELSRLYIEQVGVGHLARKNVATLSGGERQMVNLAKALCQEPQLLLLDEPTAHLDITHQARFMDLLLEQALSGRTILMIMHDLSQAAAYTDQLLFMKEGRLHSLGQPDEVFSPELIEEVFQIGVRVNIDPETQQKIISPKIRKKKG